MSCQATQTNQSIPMITKTKEALLDLIHREWRKRESVTPDLVSGPVPTSSPNSSSTSSTDCSTGIKCDHNVMCVSDVDRSAPFCSPAKARSEDDRLSSVLVERSRFRWSSGVVKLVSFTLVCLTIMGLFWRTTTLSLWRDTSLWELLACACTSIMALVVSSMSYNVCLLCILCAVPYQLRRARYDVQQQADHLRHEMSQHAQAMKNQVQTVVTPLTQSGAAVKDAANKVSSVLDATAKTTSTFRTVVEYMAVIGTLLGLAKALKKRYFADEDKERAKLHGLTTSGWMRLMDGMIVLFLVPAVLSEGWIFADKVLKKALHYSSVIRTLVFAAESVTLLVGNDVPEVESASGGIQCFDDTTQKFVSKIEELKSKPLGALKQMKKTSVMDDEEDGVADRINKARSEPHPAPSFESFEHAYEDEHDFSSSSRDPPALVAQKEAMYNIVGSNPRGRPVPPVPVAHPVQGPENKSFVRRTIEQLQTATQSLSEYGQETALAVMFVGLFLFVAIIWTSNVKDKKQDKKESEDSEVPPPLPVWREEFAVEARRRNPLHSKERDRAFPSPPPAFLVPSVRTEITTTKPQTSRLLPGAVVQHATKSVKALKDKTEGTSSSVAECVHYCGLAQTSASKLCNVDCKGRTCTHFIGCQPLPQSASVSPEVEAGVDDDDGFTVVGPARKAHGWRASSSSKDEDDAPHVRDAAADDGDYDEFNHPKLPNFRDMTQKQKNDWHAINPWYAKLKAKGWAPGQVRFHNAPDKWIRLGKRGMAKLNHIRSGGGVPVVMNTATGPRVVDMKSTKYGFLEESAPSRPPQSHAVVNDPAFAQLKAEVSAGQVKEQKTDEEQFLNIALAARSVGIARTKKASTNCCKAAGSLWFPHHLAPDVSDEIVVSMPVYADNTWSLVHHTIVRDKLCLVQDDTYRYVCPPEFSTVPSLKFSKVAVKEGARVMVLAYPGLDELASAVGKQTVDPQLLPGTVVGVTQSKLVNRHTTEKCEYTSSTRAGYCAGPVLDPHGRLIGLHNAKSVANDKTNFFLVISSVARSSIPGADF